MQKKKKTVRKIPANTHIPKFFILTVSRPISSFFSLDVWVLICEILYKVNFFSKSNGFSIISFAQSTSQKQLSFFSLKQCPVFSNSRISSLFIAFGSVPLLITAMESLIFPINIPYSTDISLKLISRSPFTRLLMLDCLQ